MRYYKNLLSSNSKLFTIYFIGLFLALLLANILQQTVSRSSIGDSVYTPTVLSEQITKNTQVESILSRDFPQSRFVINHGDSVNKILIRSGIIANEVDQIIKVIKPIINPRKMKIGTTINIDFDLNKIIKGKPWVNGLEIRGNNNKKLRVFRDVVGNFAAQEISVPLVRKIVRKTGVINNSFIATAVELSVPHQAIIEMVKAYSYDVDFQRDLKNGDKLDVIMDRYYTDDGKFSHNGNVVYAALEMGSRKMVIYQFSDKNGEISYFNDKGLSVKKDLLRTPINAAKISSGFGVRKHPVLGYSRMHKGVDFAASIGTPILAAGAGVVEEIGYKGGYGKYVRIKHNGSYSTAYAHANNFARGLKKGSKVKQGQVIAYVGTTGISTGAHLHYEVLQHGKHINPQKMKLSSYVRLIGQDLTKFHNLKLEVDKILSSLNPKLELEASNVFKSY